MMISEALGTAFDILKKSISELSKQKEPEQTFAVSIQPRKQDESFAKSDVVEKSVQTTIVTADTKKNDLKGSHKPRIDAAMARNAIILSEILGPAVSKRGRKKQWL